VSENQAARSRGEIVNALKAEQEARRRKLTVAADQRVRELMLQEALAAWDNWVQQTSENIPSAWFATILEDIIRQIQEFRFGIPGEGAARDRYIPFNATGQILLLVLMWIIVMITPIAIQESKISGGTQQSLNDYYGLIAGLAVSITFLIAPKLKKPPRK
jgi:hypothetical protein